MNDFVVNGRFHVEDHLVIVCGKLIRNAHAITGGIQLPAFRSGQLPRIVFTMRETAAEGQLTVLVRDAGCNQCIRLQRTIRVRDAVRVIQAEKKAFAGSVHQGGMPHPVVALFCGHHFFFLDQRDLRLHEFVLCLYTDFDNRRAVVRSGQNDIVVGFIQNISGRCGYLGDNVMPQGKKLRFADFLRGSRDGCYQLIGLEPDRSLLADDILGGAHLIDRARKRTILIDRRVNRVAKGVLAFNEAL